MSKVFDPRPAPGTLSGIRVLEHTTALAGPYCAQLLGDLGADVIKIERPGKGDQARGWGPPFIEGESAYFLGTNRNKRGLTLNLDSKNGRDVLHKLLQEADVLIHNVPKQATRNKLGLDRSTCFSCSPRLIWANISGFGNDGPLAEKPGYDILAQAMSGTMYITGEPEHEPIRFPTAMADLSAGIYTAMAILAALFKRERTGKGEAIETALLDTQLTWLAYLASSHLATGEPVRKFGNAHPNIVPYQSFRTADSWLMLAVGSERLWQRLLEVLEWPELGEDPRYRTNADRNVNRDTLIPKLIERFRTRSTEEWVAMLEKAGIPAGPVLTPEDALSHEHIRERGMIVEIEHPLIGKIRSLGNPVKLRSNPITYRLPPPRLGEHTEQILLEAGYSAHEIHELKDEGAI